MPSSYLYYRVHQCQVRFLVELQKNVTFTPEGLASFLKLFKIPVSLYKGLSSELKKDLVLRNEQYLPENSEFPYLLDSEGRLVFIGAVSEEFFIPLSKPQDIVLTPLSFALPNTHKAELLQYSFKHNKVLTRIGASDFPHARVYVVSEIFPVRRWSVYTGVQLQNNDFLCERMFVQSVKSYQDFNLSASLVLNVAERGLEKYEESFCSLSAPGMSFDAIVGQFRKLKQVKISKRLIQGVEGLLQSFNSESCARKAVVEQVFSFLSGSHRTITQIEHDGPLIWKVLLPEEE